MYLPSLKGGLCKSCVLFGRNHESLGTFVSSPFTELWKASEKLKQHFGTGKEVGKETHKCTMEEALNFMENIFFFQPGLSKTTFHVHN